MLTTKLRRTLALGALASLLLAGTAVAVPVLYRIQIDNVGGVFSFIDPPGFACMTGAAPQHLPPNSIERRCAPTFAAATCGDPAVAVAIDGLPGANAQANGFCNTGLPFPPLASCTANVPFFAFTASCGTPPTRAGAVWPFEFVCHAPAAGAWVRYHADCWAVVG